MFSTELDDKIRRLDGLMHVKSLNMKDWFISHEGGALQEVKNLETEIDELKQ